MRNRLLRRRRDYDERGFTMTEVVMVVVMLGLIAAPLGAAMIQAIRLIPESGDRSEVAVDTTQLADAFSRDVTNDTTNPAAPNSVPPFSGVTLAYSCAVRGATNVLITNYTDGGIVHYRIYQVTAVDANGGTTIPGDPIRVTLIRHDFGTGFVVLSPAKTLAEGYCSNGAPNMVKTTRTLAATDDHRRVRMELFLSPTPDTAVAPVEFEAFVGKTELVDL